MGVIKLIETDNVVYLKTFKAAKNLRAQLIPYKNTFLRLSQIERSAEKSAIQAQLSVNPNDVIARIKLEKITEVENNTF